jgi:predicted nuclease of predicted toxin-antitoxin system
VKHVLEFAMAETSDAQIFRFAESEGYVLVSKDEDFLHLLLRATTAASLVWVRIGNCRKQYLLEAFDRAWPRLVERIESGEQIVEIQ